VRAAVGSHFFPNAAEAQILDEHWALFCEDEFVRQTVYGYFFNLVFLQKILSLKKTCDIIWM